MFGGKNRKIIYDKIQDAEYHFPDSVNMVARDLISQLTDANP